MPSPTTLSKDLDELVVLVDDNGAPCGTAPKLEAHASPGRLHLAISVVLFDGKGRLLLQRRASSKYHFPSYWSNACCSHPRPNEAPADAAKRRLFEELGLESDLLPAGSFTYQATCPVSGLVEHELDHVFVGTFDAVPRLSPGEVDDVCLIDGEQARARNFPDPVTPWLARATELAFCASKRLPGAVGR